MKTRLSQKEFDRITRGEITADDKKKLAQYEKECLAYTRRWLRRFDAVQARTAKSKLQLS